MKRHDPGAIRLQLEQLEDRRLMAVTVLQESGDLVAEIQQWKDLAFGRDSFGYLVPTAAEQADFAALALSVAEGDLATAALQADALDYDLTEFTDTVSHQTYYQLTEELVNGEVTRGWGTFFWNASPQANALVEVAHPIFDTNSWEVGGRALRKAGANGFLMAGAHRHANGTGTADVANLEDSIFETVHETWSTVDTVVWQVHGFNLDNHSHFPASTDVVLSNSDGGISDEVADLDQRFHNQGWLSFGYNTLAPNSPLNVAMNDGIDGTTFSTLGATANAQGIYTRALGGEFVHAELEQSIRFNATNRLLAGEAIGQAILASGNQPQTKFYVADTTADATFEYDASGDFVESYTLASGNTAPRGASADVTGEIVWVVDNDDTVYVYDPTGNPLGQWHAADLNRPEGIATEGQHIWIVDRGDDRVYYFADAATRLSGSASPDASFALANGNRSPRGITTDGTSLWVVNATKSVDKVYKYSNNGSLLGSWTIDSANVDPRGITTDPLNPDNLWVVDNRTDSVYEYLDAGSRTFGSQSASRAFPIDASNPQGIADPPPPASDQLSAAQVMALNVWVQHDRFPSSVRRAATSEPLAVVRLAAGEVVRPIEVPQASAQLVVRDRSIDARDHMFQSGAALGELLEIELLEDDNP